MPQGLKDKPELTRWTVPVWMAFQVLSAGRFYTEAGPGAIPLTEIEAYLRLTNVEGEDWFSYVLMLRSMDAVFMEYAAKKREQHQKKQPKTN